MPNAQARVAHSPRNMARISNAWARACHGWSIIVESRIERHRRRIVVRFAAGVRALVFDRAHLAVCRHDAVHTAEHFAAHLEREVAGVGVDCLAGAAVGARIAEYASPASRLQKGWIACAASPGAAVIAAPQHGRESDQRAVRLADGGIAELNAWRYCVRRIRKPPFRNNQCGSMAATRLLGEPKRRERVQPARIWIGRRQRKPRPAHTSYLRALCSVAYRQLPLSVGRYCAMSTHLDERYPVIDLAAYDGGRRVSRTRAGRYTMAAVMADLYAMRDATAMDVGSDLKLACVMELVGKAIKRYQ